MEGLTEVAQRGGSWAALAWPLTVLLSLAVYFYPGPFSNERGRH
jgi:hypothetical protein